MAKKRNNSRNPRPSLEWLVGIGSAFVVTALIFFLAYEALFADTGPPDLVVAIDRLEQVESGTLIVVALSNRGDQAAAEITVEATLDVNVSEPARRQIRFDYIASHATRRGAFLVEQSVLAAHEVRLAVHGYVEP